VWGVLFALYVVPIFLPTVFPDKFWLMWLISGLFFGPYMLVIIYVVVRITGSLWQFDRWQRRFVIIGTPLSVMYLTALGYVFSFVIPDDFEPFRSVTLPAIVLAVTLLVFGKTKYAKKHQVRPKTSTPQSDNSLKSNNYVAKCRESGRRNRLIGASRQCQYFPTLSLPATAQCYI
jgi:hypothetical protein